MTELIKSSRETILDGGSLDFEVASSLLAYCHNSDNLHKVINLADEVRNHFHGSKMDLCSIINARSGKCSENCRFCAQSAHHDTSVETYSLVDKEKAVLLAEQNYKYGVSKFSLVTAGKKMDLASIADCVPIYHDIAKTGMKLCASMGFLTRDTAKALFDAGVRRYHCNLETAKSFFPSVCTSHTWDEKVETLEIARGVGMELCSGGIIGLGETSEQRIEMAFELRDLGIKSIPINILNPIAGTPLGNVVPLSIDIMKATFALYRLINPQAIIRTAGGRNLLQDKQYELYESGANGAIVGDYLTTSGDGLTKDVKKFTDLGFVINKDG